MTEFYLKKEFKSSEGCIHYDDFGTGIDVVLVHGTPTSSVVWGGVIQRLQHKYRFHVLDLPGYGQSDKFEDQDVRLRSFARVLNEWVQQLGLDNPILVGHDFGAATVFGAHLVEKLPVRAICVSDGVVLSPWGTAFSRHVSEHEYTFANVPEYVHEAVIRAHLKTALARDAKASFFDSLIAPWLGEEGQKAYYRQVGQYDYEYTLQLETLYPNIKVPTMIFWGEEDQWVDISEGRRLQGIIPNAEFEALPDAGHFAMVDTPGLFAEKLDKWLDAVATS
jgi:pimeloyl-ACP methyl ester carboxylesterase